MLVPRVRQPAQVDGQADAGRKVDVMFGLSTRAVVIACLCVIFAGWAVLEHACTDDRDPDHGPILGVVGYIIMAAGVAGIVLASQGG